MDATAANRRNIFAIVFIVSLIACLGLGLIGPRLIAPSGGPITKPEWMLWASLAFGFVAVITVPFAWRWIYRRN